MIRWLEKNSVQEKRVLIRVDFNVPIRNGVIVDDFRIRAHLPTLRLLLNNKNILIILAHVGKPAGKKIRGLSVRPLVRRLSHLLRRDIVFVSDPFTKLAREKIQTAKYGSIFLVENIRFWSGEEKNDQKFAVDLSKLAEVFVQDAFGVVHRNHATLSLLPRFLPSYGGLLLKKEIESLTPITRASHRPFIVIMGGAKITTKLHILESFA